VSSLLVCLAAVLLMRADSMTLSIAVAVVVMHEGCMAAVGRVVPLIPDVVLAQNHLRALAAPPAGLQRTGMPPETPQVRTAAPGHERPHRRAEAS
jgi:hypothetical protein